MKKIFLLSIVALVVLISSCKKDNSIGASLLNPDDLLNAKFTDTFSITAKTLSDTFMRTDKLYKNYLGVINDPLFGIQKASIVMELDRPSNIFDDTLGPFMVDSTVLLLKYISIYGDTLVPQRFIVKELSSPINETQAYYSNASISTAGPISLATDYLFTPTRNGVQTSTSDSDGTVGIVRIKLDDATFGQKIMNLGQTKLRDSTLFKNEIKGIVVENDNSDGNAMAEIDLSSTNTAVCIYYKDKYGIARQAKLFPNLYRIVSGTISPQTNSINLFEKSLSTAVQNVVNSGLQNDSINYLLGQGGTIVKVNLPTIANLGKVAVNKAVLQVTQIIPNTASLTSPATSSLVLVTRNTDGNLDFIPTSVAPYFDGFGIVDSVGTDIAGNKLVRYSINISKYIQDISKGTQTNLEIYLATYRTGGTLGTKNLLATYSYGYVPSRLIFAGSNYSDNRYKMKLNLTYTLIK